MKNRKGFTLLELLAVIIILGILMGLAYMGVSRYIRSSNDALYEDYEKLRELSDKGKAFIRKNFTLKVAEEVLRKDMDL